MANFYNQLVALLRSGYPCYEALPYWPVRPKPVLKAVLEDICSRVEDGEPLP